MSRSASPPLSACAWPRRALGLAAALALTACASVTPLPARPPADTSPVPAQWSAASGSAQPTALAQWWQRFDDPQLTALVAQALQANTSVKSAQAALRQARAQRDAQAAANGPSISASASAQRSQNGNADGSNRFQTGFDARWEPDLFGGNRATLDAAEAGARAAQTGLADVQVSLAAEVAVAYIELRGLQARLDIASRNLATQQETLQITRWRAQAGLASSLDLEQAIAATEQTRAQIPALQTSVAQSLNALAVLTGQVPGALQATLGRTGAIPAAPADLALAFPAETLRQRPDVRSAEHQVSAALARVSAADAARYPSFQLSGSLGLSALTLGTLTDGASVLRSVLASVSVPLFDGGALRAQVQAQQAALDQARAAHEAAVLGALQDVEDALAALRGDREKLVRQQAAADAATNAELLARQRYQSGLIDFRTVLDTQRSRLSTQDSVASTQATLSADHVRLYKALGGGWTPADTTAATRH
ncbi:efflux transporter outer membrane subunit [Hydrogenophaga sp.]|uniref:efflux transporter outer membrane subunit n=1 Tax=Hydrogenophaga sp. TaxID=1904254 RepID=UPI00286E3E36|nr:efflux transporter outer membrane subunit [Hydrogenophaga sp.]